MTTIELNRSHIQQRLSSFGDYSGVLNYRGSYKLDDGLIEIVTLINQIIFVSLVKMKWSETRWIY